MKRAILLKYLVSLLIALATFILYLPALRNEFVYWDDNLYIFENPYIRSLDAAFFRWAFLGFHASNWHPLTWISHAVDYALWGMNPLGHHLTNIVLHAANTLIVVLLIVQLLKAARERATETGLLRFLNDRTVLISAGVTGLLFGIHPVHVESVAWVAERKDLLCALFFLLSISSYTNYMMRTVGNDAVQSNSYSRFADSRYLAALGLFLLALLSKPMAVTIPFVLLILDWHPFGSVRSFKTLWLVSVEKLPFFFLSLASSIITILAQRAGGSITSIEQIPLSIRLLVAAKSLVAYLGKMLLPMNLIPFYPYPKDASLFSFEYVSAIALVLGITAMCVILARKQKFWLTAWGYYLVTLVPVLGIIQVGGQSMADRYTYLPSLGPFLVMGLAIAWILEKMLTMVNGRGLLLKGISVTTALFLVVSLSTLTVEQIAIWKNSVGLWTYVIDEEPERVPIAYNNRGMVFYKTGRFDKAIADFDKAVTLRSSYIEGYSNLGMAFYRIGRFDKAIENFDKAITLNPEYYKGYNNRAMAFGKMGRSDKAVEDYHRAIALNPSSPQAYYNLGALYGQAGLFDQAIEQFNRSLAVDPQYADAYINRGVAFSFIGQYDRALNDFRKALEMHHDPAAVYVNRGNVYLKTGRRGLALADFQRACDLGDAFGCSLAHSSAQGLAAE